MTTIELVAGNTVPITFVHMVGEDAKDIPEGHDMKVGLFKEHGSEILSYSFVGGDIARVGEGIYLLTLPHNTTKHFSGIILMAAVIYNQDCSVVKHCGEPVGLSFVPAKMNKAIEQ